jgi:hypothetical protein
VAQVIEHLLCKCETLNSNSSPGKKQDEEAKNKKKLPGQNHQI